MTRGRAIHYSAEEHGWLQSNCTQVGPELTRQFNSGFGREVSQDNLRNYCQRHGWLTGRTGRFEKGVIPPNKGKKGMPSHPNMVPTQFKKGQRSRNYKGPGHEYVDNKDGYVWLIVAGPSPYSTSTSVNCHPVMKHRHLWEQQNGPIPKDHVLKCLTSDKTNCDPSNWALVPKSVMPRLAGRWSLGYDEAPDELKPVLLQAAMLEHAAREARRSIGKLTASERYAQRRKKLAAR